MKKVKMWRKSGRFYKRLYLAAGATRKIE